MKKIISIFALSALVLASLFSCTKVEELANTTQPLPAPTFENVALQGLDITPKTSYLVVGETADFTVALYPTEAKVSEMVWTSSDAAVASVDNNGHLEAKGKGTATITVKAGEKSASALVTVYSERVAATEIKLNKEELNLLVGRYTSVKAILLPDGSAEDGIATTDKPAFEWSSSNPQVATVDYGVVRATGLGEATITVKQGSLSASCKVTVADKIKLQDRSGAWTVTDTPKWDKNWNGQITGSHEEVNLSGCDAEYHIFGVVDAEKFAGIEAISDDIYNQVQEALDGGQDPKGLFGKGESDTKSYSDLGNATAYVLGYDSEFEFTGEYVVYNFEARTPDPVHATGIQFTQGWGNTPIEEIALKEGKSLNMFGARLLPEDCTDTGEISFKSSDESVVTLAPYYSGYYTVTAVGVGETTIVATFNDVTASIPVTVTGSSMVWTDKSSEWTGAWGMGLYYGYYECFGFTLNACSSPMHLIVVMNASDISGDPYAYYKTVASQNEGNLDWYASADVPDFSAMSWNDKDETIERYAYVFGVNSGDYDGNYAVFHYDPNGGGGEDPGPGPGPEPQEGKLVSLDGQYFPLDWDDMDAVQDEVTLEAWVNSSSFSGGKDNIYTVMGTEGIFMLRFEGSQLNLVYGGTKRDNSNEYNEKKVTYTTNFETGKWYHIAATYSRGGEAILYVDGEKVGSNTAEDHAVELNGVGAEWVLPFKFYVGVSSNTRVFKGSLAYLRVWDCARSASQIKDNMCVADPADEGYNLLASWYFNEGSGNTIADHGATEDYALTANSDLTWIDGELPF